MRILVPVKLCAAVGNQVLVEGSGENSRVLPSAQESVLNPFCAIALEQAVRLKETCADVEVTTLAISADPNHKLLQKTLALGADRVIACRLENDDISPLSIAKIISNVCDDYRPDLVILGKQSVDYDNAQVGPMLGALLAWPQAIAACSMKINGEDTLEVACEGDDGELTLRLSLPAIVTADLRLCEPRTAGLADVMRARRKQVEETSISALGIDSLPSKNLSKTLDMSIPRRQSKRQVLSSVAELAALIRNNTAAKS